MKSACGTMSVIEEIEDDEDLSDDEPPALQGLADQVAAVRVGCEAEEAEAGPSAAGGAAGVPSAKQAEPKAKAKAAAGGGSGGGGMKRGFFDAPPPKRKPKPKAKEEEIPMLRAKPKAPNAPKDIPEGFRVQLEDEEKARKMKEELKSALKPDQATLGQVMQDPTLMAGFDDPEVMAAVDEIAKDPSKMAKHANNPKVMRFYQAMAGMVGQKLTKMGEEQDMQQQGQQR